MERDHNKVVADKLRAELDEAVPTKVEEPATEDQAAGDDIAAAEDAPAALSTEEEQQATDRKATADGEKPDVVNLTEVQLDEELKNLKLRPRTYKTSSKQTTLINARVLMKRLAGRTEKELETSTVKTLRDQLKSIGLPASGAKRVLSQRLITWRDRVKVEKPSAEVEPERTWRPDESNVGSIDAELDQEFRRLDSVIQDMSRRDDADGSVTTDLRAEHSRIFEMFDEAHKKGPLGRSVRITRIEKAIKKLSAGIEDRRRQQQV